MCIGYVDLDMCDVNIYINYMRVNVVFMLMTGNYKVRET